jgi:hypothetical protein
MKSIKPNPGHIFASIDLASAEPTVITHYTNDMNYRRLTFDMVGKPPVRENGILFIDDIYLAYMSATPMGRPVIDNLWRRDWGGHTFAEQWLVDPEVIKKAVKKERAVFKAMALGLGYGMGPKKLRKTAFENGFTINEDEAYACYNSYWTLFHGVRAFADQMSKRAERLGYLVNEFGFRQGGVEPRKAFNWLIQSTVNPVIILFTQALLQEAPYARLVTIIHDEDIIELPIDKQEHFKAAKERAERQLNNLIKFSVHMRTGLVFGETFYDAK